MNDDEIKQKFILSGFRKNASLDRRLDKVISEVRADERVKLSLADRTKPPYWTSFDVWYDNMFRHLAGDKPIFTRLELKNAYKQGASQERQRIRKLMEKAKAKRLKELIPVSNIAKILGAEMDKENIEINVDKLLIAIDSEQEVK